MLKFTTAVAFILVCASLALAAKGGNGKPGGGGGGGGGGEDPPADPAIVYIDRTGGALVPHVCRKQETGKERGYSGYY